MTVAAWQSCYVLGLNDGPSVWNALLSKLHTLTCCIDSYKHTSTTDYAST